jgi:putative hemolysin
VEEAASAGVVHQSAGDIASRALAFSELDAATVMVPRSRMVSVPATATLDDLAQVALRSGHSRVLVYRSHTDDIVGFVNLREALARGRSEPNLSLETVLHPVAFVPTSMSAPVLLRDLQQRRMQLAVVVDEQGTIRGLLTMEDLLEELVGEILSEHSTPDGPIQREPGGSVLVDAATALHELNRELGLSLPEGEDYKTVGGLVLELAGRIPTSGDRFEAEDYELEVVEASHRKVKRVRIHCPHDPEADEDVPPDRASD